MNPSNLKQVLETFNTESKSTREKGKKFEVLMQKALLKDSSIAGEFKQVYLWNEFPYKDGIDIGIDLVAIDSFNQYVAIQCKFYKSTVRLSKISNFTAQANTQFKSKKADKNSKYETMSYSRMILISTTNNISVHAKKNLFTQEKRASVIYLSDLKKSKIDWKKLCANTDHAILKKDITSRPYQQKAINACKQGFKQADRGKLIMACGTGKTFTSLKFTEAFAKQGDFVLFLVPSIALMSQSIREWLQEKDKELNIFSVCSDASVVGQKGTRLYEIPYPATTKLKQLQHNIEQSDTKDNINIIFSTYQSIDIIIKAQKQKTLPMFHLTICDEAHRTTGCNYKKLQSHFTKVHNDILSRKRLYMTATPRIYKEVDKTKANSQDQDYYSMDEEQTYGKVFFKYGFNEAVKDKFLSDYKVIVLATPETSINTNPKDLDSEDLDISDQAKLLGCYNALQKKNLNAQDELEQDLGSMKRAVAFTRTIKDSKSLTHNLADVIETNRDPKDPHFTCHSRHVDGQMSSGARDTCIDWLKEPGSQNECKILFNARCLSEGIDVPSLDAVLFLSAKNSEIDIVQSVGRVMRKCEGKKYGYIIIPIIIPSKITAKEALDDNAKYKAIWQVVQALRSHDSSIGSEIQKLKSNEPSSKIQVIGMDQNETCPIANANFKLFTKAIYGKIVSKCGERLYWDDWAKHITSLASVYEKDIEKILKKEKFNQAFDQVLQDLNKQAGVVIDQQELVKMIIQHVISQPIFNTLFPDHSLAQDPVFKQIDNIIKHFNLNLKHLKALNPVYKAAKSFTASTLQQKQEFIKEIYSKLFTRTFPKDSSKLGIMYTPIPIVDFMINSVEHLLKKEFKLSLNDPGVSLLDPFLGSGTFITRLIHSGHISQHNMAYKLNQDIQANEILLLAHYISKLNIESSYFEVTKSKINFKLALTDSLKITNKKFQVIIGNPPYSAGQKSANNANQNSSYPKVEQRIRDTYNKQSKANTHTGDSYIKALRWASDNLQNKGVLAFIHNGSLLDGIGTDGLRTCLEQEFMNVYCLNLRGGARGRGKIRKKEADNVFGSGSRTSVCISFFVKNTSQKNKKATIYYHDIGDYLTQEDKLNSIKEFCSIEKTPWKIIKPNKHYDWINQRDLSYETYLALGDKKNKNTNIIFDTYSCGILSNRDAWAYNFCKDKLAFNMKNMMRVYNSQIKNLQNKIDFSQYSYKTIDKHIDRNPKKISWSRGLKQAFLKKTATRFNNKKIITSSYRPFTKKYLYFDKIFNEMLSLNPKIWFDNQDIYQSQKNKIICVSGRGAKQFSVLMTDHMPDVNYFQDTIQSFPLYYFDKTGTKKPSINDASLSMFQSHYINTSITKEDIFYYIYGILHAKTYQNKYKNNLLKDLPHIPLYKDFKAFAKIGRDLGNLHINYENQPAPKEINILKQEKQISKLTSLDSSSLKVTKMKFLKTRDLKNKLGQDTIIYNSEIRITNIPKEAYVYKINNRLAIELVMQNYRVKRDRDSGIVNDPNNPEDPRYILKLLLSVIAVSLKTNDLINQLPKIHEDVNQLLDLNLLIKRVLVYTMHADKKIKDAEKEAIYTSYKKITGFIFPKASISSHLKAFNQEDWSRESLLKDLKTYKQKHGLNSFWVKQLLEQVVQVIFSDKDSDRREIDFLEDLAINLDYPPEDLQELCNQRPKHWSKSLAKTQKLKPKLEAKQKITKIKNTNSPKKSA